MDDKESLSPKQCKLIEDHLYLIKKLQNSYFKYLIEYKDELPSLINFSLVEGALTYKEGIGTFEGYIVTLIKRRLIDYYRKHTRRKYHLLNKKEYYYQEHRFEEIIEDLNDIDKLIFRLIYQYNYKQTEIAKQLDMSEAAISKRHSRALRKLAS